MLPPQNLAPFKIMIHRALKLLRSYHNLKQKDLATRLGLSPSHLSEIESGSKPVSYDLLEKYSKVFDIPVSSITLFAEVAQSGESKGIQATIADKALRMLEWLETISRYDNDSPKQPDKLQPF